MANNVATLDTSPVAMLEQLPWWQSISRKDQISIEKETKALGEAFQNMGRSRLAAAEHLSNVHDKVGKGNFQGFLRIFHIKRAWAYETMKGYKNTLQAFPEAVIREAMRRNMPILGASDDKPLGTYTDAVKRLPPPKTEDPVKIGQYLDSIEQARSRARARASKKLETIEADPDVLLQESYRFVIIRLQRLGSKGATRNRFVESLTGMLMTEIGVTKRNFEAEAIPDGFRAQVGRPRKETEEAA